MTTITPELLRRIMPRAGDKADLFAPFLDAAKDNWVGNDPDEIAHWLAQIAHESGQLRYVEELADGRAYEGRADLGNNKPGDGVMFKGRGLIQLTGRSNYEAYSKARNFDFISDPRSLALPEYAADVAGWFWHANKINKLVSASDPVLAVTRRVNGGTNGLDERRAFYKVAREEILASLIAAGPAPIEESTPSYVAPSIPAQSSKEFTVIPAFIAAAIPALIQALPELGRIITNRNVPERNIAIATKALEVIGPAINASNAQDAIEKLVSDPQARAIARESVREMLEVIEVGGGIEAARKFSADMINTGPTAGRIGWGITVATLAFGIVIGGGWIMREVLVGNLAGFDIQVRASILDYMKNMGLIVAGFVFGSSVGSRGKDAK